MTMKTQWILTFALVACTLHAGAAGNTLQSAESLNNQGIAALERKDFPTAFKKFRAALQVDPNYPPPKTNLPITHGQYGLQLRKGNRLTEALREIHKAGYWGGVWDDEVDKTVRTLGKNPNSFEDRVQLADEALKAGDHLGAAVEYRAALSLKSDPQVQRELDNVSRSINERDLTSEAH